MRHQRHIQTDALLHSNGVSLDEETTISAFESIGR